VRVRMLTVCLLALGGWLWSPSLAADGSFVAPVEAATYSVAVQQQPLSTIPPLPQSPAQRFSTIPPLPPTSTPVRPLPTQVQAPSPLPTRAVPAAPTPIPLRPTSTLPPAPSQLAPRAGGFPTGAALLVFAVSTTALGGGLYMLARLRAR
jgi:hypothetical protein